MVAEISRSDVRVLDPRKISFRRDDFGRLHLGVGIEERYGPVRVVRCLPLTQPGRWISVQDEDGDEIGLIEDLARLDDESRGVLERELELQYLKGHVLAIHGVENRNGILSWDLETDLGRKMVHLRDRQNIRRLRDGRIILTDIHDGKYEVPPRDQLDERSREWLEIET